MPSDRSGDEDPQPDGGTVSVSMKSDHGEIKRRLATLIGADPSRYADTRGIERHKRLTLAEIEAICEELGIGFIDGTKQTKKDAVMLKLGRDHRTGAGMWDASDLLAVIERIEGGGSDV